MLARCARSHAWVWLAAATLVAACGTQSGTASRSAVRPTPSTTTSASASAPASPTATPGDFGDTPEGLTFTWAAGYSPPSWLPAFIARAPAAPSGGSIVCGVNSANSLYTALVRYDPTRAAGAITIQIQGFHGAGTYTNGAGSLPVDVEVSPPAPNLTGLSGFEADGASVQVAADLRSGTLTSPLQSGPRIAGTISGSWRCG